jgi:cytoskeletal protein CcmA (bactofilin family)
MQETGLKPAARNGKGGEGEAMTVLARGDSLKGRLAVAGDGRILGAFEGQIECQGELLVGEEAEVSADVRCVNLTIAGGVRGNVVASGRMRITSTGRLRGDAQVGSLVVEEGGVHHGSIQVHPEGVPEGERQRAARTPAAPAEPPRTREPGSLAASMERVRRFWAELF